MEYFINLLKKSLKSAVVTTILILVLWVTLYNLTNFETVAVYLGIGVAVCVFNTWVDNLRKRKIVKILQVRSSWIVMAGAVLVLHYAGFTAAAVVTAAAIFAMPFFGATIYEGVVGLTLLVTLARLIP